MVTAITLLDVNRNHVTDVARTLSDIEGVSEVYSVAGRCDLVVVIRVPENDDLRDLVTSEMLAVEGIEDSETMFAFQVHSQHDLENMFSLGSD